LRLAVVPRFAGTPLVLDSLANTSAAGQFISVTRLDFLLSGLALHRADGVWVAATNQFAYLNGRAGRTTFTLPSLPAGDYDRVRFHIGVPERDNHANPASLAADHPLNPNVNGLHWNWQGGYVFFAIEGDWIKPDGKRSGYSYHLATDRLLMTVELPVKLDLGADLELGLALNVDQVFSAPHRLRITDDFTSTHSRAEDQLADQLHENLQHAFAVESVRVVPPSLLAARGPVTIEMATNATPYRLTISRFFPQPALPLDNPLTEEGVELGRHLFHDSSLSINNRQSCASCHQAERAFADSRPYSLGAEGQAGARHAMPLFNLAWKNSFFWDGRAPSLRDQVLRPIQDPLEMHETLTNVVRKLDALASNQVLFARAFGTPEITADRIARALEQFLLTRVSHHSRFDRSLAGKAELTEEEKRGFELFNTEYDPRRGQFGADCFHCHGGPLFQSQGFANNGLDAEGKDRGRALVTGKSGDKGRFAVPSLRNVAITAPYMHDGRFTTLEEVVAHYSTGVQRSATLDPNLAKHPDGGLQLGAEDQRALLAFLNTLTDE
jgi:cytochrome c peroxidase